MGVFDRVFVVDNETAKLFLCGDGHSMFNVELQTKDLDCALDDYYVFNGLFYKRGRKSKIPTDYVVSGNDLILYERYEAHLFTIQDTIELHTHCEQCDPVCFEDEHTFMGDHISDRTPSCRWEAVFENGRLRKVTSQCETREELRKSMAKNGVAVLPDDDRVVKRHFEVRRRDRMHRLF